MFNGRILFAGADVHLAELTAVILEKRGYQVVIVHSTADIVPMIQKRRPHLVILDQAQTGVTKGIDLCRELRDLFTREEIPILLLVRAGEEGPILEGLEVGANECLTIPYKAPELLAKTTILIRRRKREESRRLVRRVLQGVVSGEHVDLSRGIPFGPYILEAVLGRGCMGAVFLAQHPKKGETLALKVLDPDFHTDGRAMKRLHREGRLLMGIRHPHIVKVHEVSRCEGFHYLAMEYVQGESLIHRLERCDPTESIDLKEAFEVMLQVASALGAMWKMGLIHRDVKPENILLTSSGSAKLVDFGLARAKEDEPLTKSGIIYGTPNYMSPEQIQGSELDLRTDIYSLGATAYHLVTGFPPFDSPSTRGILYRHVFENVRSPDSLRPDLPPVASDTVCRMMAKDPAERFQSYQALRKALERARDAVAVSGGSRAAILND